MSLPLFIPFSLSLCMRGFLIISLSLFHCLYLSLYLYISHLYNLSLSLSTRSCLSFLHTHLELRSPILV